MSNIKIRDALKPFTKFAGSFLTGYRDPLFIPSVFSNMESLALDRARGRARKMEAGMISFLAHAAIISLAFLMIRQAQKILPQGENVVFTNTPISLPFEGYGQGDDGGGGGGDHAKSPATTGRLPDAARVQMMPPDPGNITPLSAAEDLVALMPSVQMPFDIPQNQSLPIGDISSPPNGIVFPGRGNGGGIGDGDGLGVGRGRGPGAGSGSNGGLGDGPNGGAGGRAGIHIIGNGVIEPIPLYQPHPSYTEAARKARIEGIVIVQVIIRKDGTVDGFKILRGLGYGLDESVIGTIGSKWRFKPATLNGKPVDVQADIQVDFRIY
jgi:periplasmic protein TonB